jgi:NADH:ubiquinone oxidoreductase subunit E
MLTVELCMGTSCHLMGVQDLVAVLESLPVDQRQRIEIKGVTCFKNCGKGPNIRINGELINNVTPDLLLEVLQANLS